MLNRIKRFLSLPAFDDENAHLGRLLTVLLPIVFVIVIALTVALVALSTGTEQSLRLIFGGTASTIVLGLYLLNRRGHTRFVRLLLPAVSLAIVSATVFLLGGLRSPLTSAYLVVIAIAGLLLGGWGAALFALLSSLAVLGILYFETQTNLINPAQASTGIQAWIIYAAYFSLMAVVFRMAARSIREGLESARRLHSVEQARAKDLSGLLKVTRTALETPDFPQMLQVLADQLTELFGADDCYMTLWDEAEQRVIPAATHGDMRATYSALAFDPGEVTMTASVLKAGRALVAEDVLNSPYVSPRLAAQFPMRSMLGLPLIVRNPDDQKLGAALITFNRPRRFTPEEIALGEQAAQQIALALANKRALEAERRRSAELEALRQAALSLTSNLELQPAFETILVQTLKLVPADDAHIFLYDHERLTFGAALWGGSLRKKPYAQTRPGGITDTVARSGERIIVPNTDTHPLFQTGGWGGAIASFPLRVGQQVRGVMNIAFEQPYQFSDDEIRVLELLADQAAIALGNARLFETERHRAAQLSLLADVSRQVVGTLDEAQILQRAVEVMVRHFGFAEAGISFPAGQDELELVASAGTENVGVSVGFRQKVGQGIIGYVAQTRETYVINDIGQDPHYFNPLGRKTGSAVGLPLLREETLLGVLYIETSRPGAFSAEDVETLGTLANQIATAWQNARLYARTQERLREITVLQSISQIVASSLELKQIFQTIVQLLGQVLGYHYVSIYQLEGERLRLKMQLGYPAESVIDEVPITAGVMGRAVQTRQTQFIKDVSSDPAFLRASPEVQSEISVPLLKDKTVLGVLNVESGSQRLLTEADVDLLNTFAAQVTVAIENARLFEAERNQRELAEALREVGAALSASLDMETVLDHLLEQIARVVPYDAGNIMLVEEGRTRIARMRGYDRFGASVVQEVATLSFEIATTPNFQSMIETGRPLVVPDTAADPGWAKLDSGVPAKGSWVGAPVMVQGQALALFSLDKFEPNFYQPEHAERLAAFAGQAALALQNARLFESTRRQVDELMVLHAVATAAAKVSSEDELIRRATQLIGRTLDPDTFGIMLLDEAAGVLRPHPSYQGIQPEDSNLGQRTVPLAEGITGAVAARGQPWRISDLRQEPAYLNAEGSAMRSELCVPLKVGGRVIGVINAESAKPNAFDGADERLLVTFAGQLATAIENVRLFAATTEALAREQRLNEVAHTISGALDLQAILQNVVRLAVELVGAHAGAMSFVSADGESLDLPYVFNLPEALYLQPMPKGQGLAWKIVETGQPILLSDYSQHPEAIPAWIEAGIRSVIGVPIVAGEARLGTMGLFSLNPQKRFTPRDLALAESVAQQAGVAIQNARLFEAERRRAEEQRLLYDATREFTAGLAEEAVLRAIGQHMTSIFNAAWGSVSLWEQEQDRLKTLFNYGNVPEDAVKGPGFTYHLSDYPLTQQVLENRQPIIVRVDDPTADAAERALLQKFGSSVLLMLPLVVGDKAFGLVELYRNLGALPFSASDLQLAQSLAAQAAIAFENARLHTTVQERARELNALLTAHTALLSTLDLDGLLHNILTASIAAIPRAEKGTVLLVDPATQQLQIRAISGYHDLRLKPEVQVFTFAGSEGYSAKALREKRPLLISDAYADPDLRYEGDIAEVREIASAIVAPLMLQAHPLGVIALDATRLGAFTEADLRLLVAFANTAAVAIDHARLHAEVHALAVTDGLTGLMNHRAFDRAIQAEVARASRYEYPLALIFLDIDSFKDYNETYGHPAGNRRLQAIAALLHANVRHPDMAARYGGEEFALILPHTDHAGALILAERIRAAAEASAPPGHAPGAPVSGYTLSLGVAAFPRDALTAEALLVAADNAELAGKRAGKNRVIAAPPLSALGKNTTPRVRDNANA